MHRFFVMRDDRARSDVAAPSGRTGADDIVAAEPWAIGSEIELSKSDAEHIARVLRLTTGQAVIICDGHAFDYEARLVHVSPRSVRARITSVEPSDAEPQLSLSLVQGIAKGSKMDLIIQKAVEVGVSRIIPVLTERTVVRLDGAKADSRVERWQRIAYEAAKQAGRGRVPAVESIYSWSELWQRDDLGFVIVPWEEEGAAGLLQTVRKAESSSEVEGSDEPANEVGVRELTIVIGPEGGLSADEIALAKRRGAHPVTLGPRILRTETAAIVASALVLGACGELG